MAQPQMAQIICNHCNASYNTERELYNHKMTAHREFGSESVKLEKQEAPQKEIERQQKEADDLEVARQKNRKIFLP